MGRNRPTTPPSKPPETTGYGSWLAMGLVMTALIALPLVWGWCWWPVRVFCLVWLAVAWAIAALGCMARHKERHPSL